MTTHNYTLTAVLYSHTPQNSKILLDILCTIFWVGTYKGIQWSLEQKQPSDTDIIITQAASTLEKKETFICYGTCQSYAFKLSLTSNEITLQLLQPYKYYPHTSLPDLDFYTDMFISLIDEFGIHYLAVGTNERVTEIEHEFSLL